MAKHFESVKIAVIYEGGLSFKAVFLNKVRLKLRKGVATADVKPGVAHSLKWEVLGVPGTKWSWRLVAQEGFQIEPVDLEKKQENQLKKAGESPPAVPFSVVPKKDEKSK